MMDDNADGLAPVVGVRAGVRAGVLAGDDQKLAGSPACMTELSMLARANGPELCGVVIYLRRARRSRRPSSGLP